MALRRNAPDKVKLKLRGDGRPLGDLGQDLLPADETPVVTTHAEIHDQDGRAYLDWSGGRGAAAFGHHDPRTAERVIVAGLNALGEADPESHRGLVELSARLAEGLSELAGSAPDRLRLEIRSAPGLVWLAFGNDPQGADQARFTEAMRSRGIWLPSEPGFPWQVGLGHDLASIDRTLMAASDALGELA